MTRSAPDRPTPLEDALVDLAAAGADLTDERHALTRALTEHRDAAVDRGQHRRAALWQSLALVLRASEGAERATLDALEDDLSPVVRPMTPEELAETWPDEVEPP